MQAFLFCIRGNARVGEVASQDSGRDRDAPPVSQMPEMEENQKKMQRKSKLIVQWLSGEAWEASSCAVAGPSATSHSYNPRKDSDLEVWNTMGMQPAQKHGPWRGCHKG